MPMGKPLLTPQGTVRFREVKRGEPLASRRVHAFVVSTCCVVSLLIPCKFSPWQLYVGLLIEPLITLC